ncbi:hypothetical protein LV780_11320 [Cereibacter azotoformans]|uniref:Uncharacterized protein n=1 Tax=Cereibacter azotoformans TaxID=43057 RepID=A0A2T5K7J4_9RHOB|nr:hypothetical protein [Cereibacter azotoformans]AXQ94346.1 hypothetical protein D0Z66_11345 [Cereibacter sphaeroides]MBO4167835.1 hypothetical protein [Cereibacter azotoformans]PTR18397.1 hypothetical protein C8J28_108118 [Cereibacter azotoformans]UIJ29890.1 hypothetical protein LV780_11320 [Cereibacter azotoformans]
MAEPQDKPVDLGFYARERLAALSPLEAGVAGAGLLWTFSVALHLIFRGGESVFAHVLAILAVVLPLVLTVAMVQFLRIIRQLRAENERMASAVDAMRKAHLVSQQGGAARVALEKRVEELAVAQHHLDLQLAALFPPEEPTPAPAEHQPALELGGPRKRAPLTMADLVRAMNFPESAEDRAGFRALRRALEDPASSKLIRAAQDVLTLLSQIGLFMEDLQPDRARPEIWRRFAEGERGRAISDLGGIHDKDALASVTAKMREDPVFRDAAHHFLRAFDRTVSQFAATANDGEIAEMAETRTTRAFMLISRASGTFD